MNTEIKHDNPIWLPLIKEGEEILGRIMMHQGTFEYLSQTRKGHFMHLVIRPIQNNAIVNGQPMSHSYSDLFISAFSDKKKQLHLARYYYQ